MDEEPLAIRELVLGKAVTSGPREGIEARD
jgi:hypothetical protein